MLTCSGTLAYAAGQRWRQLDTPGVSLGQAPQGSQPAGAQPQHDAVVGLLGPRGLICSGVLVQASAFLTAKHCMGARTVIVGADATAPALARQVRRWRTPASAALDIALGFIDDLPIQPYPLRLQERPPPREVRVVGYGALDFTKAESGGKRSYFDARVHGWGCDELAAARTGCIHGNELLIPRSAGADSCSGDSGGAVLERYEGGWRALAVTSRAVAMAVLPCGDGGIYVRTDAVSEWLTRELRDGNAVAGQAR